MCIYELSDLQRTRLSFIAPAPIVFSLPAARARPVETLFESESCVSPAQYHRELDNADGMETRIVPKEGEAKEYDSMLNIA